MDYSRFKSGSDIRGFGLGDENNRLYLSNQMVYDCTKAFFAFVCDKYNKTELKIAVGRDCRLSGDRIINTVICALKECGTDVFNCGIASTPAMFMTTQLLHCDAAVQITASHHPMDRNGLKFFIKEGGLEGDDILDILTKYQNQDFCSKKCGNVTDVDFMSAYAELLRNIIIDKLGSVRGNKPLTGMKIVVDAGNGVGGFYANDVLAPLGADISGSIFLDPDGSFPNHAPNPENPVAMKMCSDAVISSHADLGIVFDTDVDRAAVVDSSGLEINRNKLVALASVVALENNKGATVVTDSVTSDGLHKFIEELGGKHLRYKRGYRNVIDKQLELCREGQNVPLAMETSGHAAFSENYYLDDGAYLVTKLIIKAAELTVQGKRLGDLILNLQQPVEEKELRFRILPEDFKSAGENVIRSFFTAVDSVDDWTCAEDNFEGIRVNSAAGYGWFLIRLSVHDPIIVVNCESDSVGGTKVMLTQIYNIVKDNVDIDISTLKEFLEV